MTVAAKLELGRVGEVAPAAGQAHAEGHGGAELDDVLVQRLQAEAIIAGIEVKALFQEVEEVA